MPASKLAYAGGTPIACSIHHHRRTSWPPKIRAVGTMKMKSGLSEGGAVTCSSLSVCSGVNSTLGEATFWATCSARLAPISTDETPGRCAT